MRASINQTGRKMISSNDLSIKLTDDSNLRFQWDLRQLEFDQNLEAILELSSVGKNERIHIEHQVISTPGELNISLANFVQTKGIIGRICQSRRRGNTSRAGRIFQKSKESF